MSNLMKTLTIGSSTYEVCDANAREELENKISYNVQSLTADQQAQVRTNIGAASPAEINAAVKKAAPRNLLDNSDFTNVVNQRGITESTGGYGIDRWLLANSDGILEVRSDHIKLTGTNAQLWLQQDVPDLSKYADKPACFVVEMISGAKAIARCVLSTTNEGGSTDVEGVIVRIEKLNTNGYGTVSIVAGHGFTCRIKNAALYIGEYNETIPEYQPKGYSAELHECMRYYQPTLCGFGFVRTEATTATVTFPIVPMRRTGVSVEKYTFTTMRSNGQSFDESKVTNAQVLEYRKGAATIKVNFTGTFTGAGNQVACVDAVVWLTAESFREV